MDVVIRTDQESGGYWIRFSGEGLCKGLNTYAMLLYSGFNYTSMLIDGPVNIFSDYYKFFIHVIAKNTNKSSFES